MSAYNRLEDNSVDVIDPGEGVSHTAQHRQVYNQQHESQQHGYDQQHESQHLESQEHEFQQHESQQHESQQQPNLEEQQQHHQQQQPYQQDEEQQQTYQQQKQQQLYQQQQQQPYQHQQQQWPNLQHQHLFQQQQHYGSTIVSAQPQMYTAYNPSNTSESAAQPDSYLCWSIITLCWCCWLIGIFAVCKSMAVRTAVANGNMDAARKHSEEAKRLNVCGLVFGTICIVASVAGILLMQQSNPSY